MDDRYVGIDKQQAAMRAYFESGQTRDINFRINALKTLRQAIQKRESEIIAALHEDLGKSEFESYATEIGFVYHEIRHAIKHIKKWSKPRSVRTPLSLQLATSKIHKEPYGIALIIGPFNYPFQLIMDPLVGAIAAGNCVILKPSEESAATSTIIASILSDVFCSEYVCVYQGDKDVTQALVQSDVDTIFFTGSVRVGRSIMESASKKLTPVTLELGGKSPVIVDSSANLKHAAKRIVWGKFLNAGQTCVAPDYILVHESIHDTFLTRLNETIRAFYGEQPELSRDYGRIINERHFKRLTDILEADHKHIITGGLSNKDTLYIQPTLLSIDALESASMQGELFGPILPVLKYTHFKDVKDIISKYPNPLALYLFTEDKKMEQRVLESIQFGGGCVNDTVSHLANGHLPFGGRGTSGMGSYHGIYSFDAFSHSKSILKKSVFFDHGIVYPPYRNKVRIVRKIMK